VNGSAKIIIREFRYPHDYEPARQLWLSIEKGVHLGRSDQPAEIEKKLQRDPDLFLVAEAAGRIVGTVIGGYDGRRGLVYHLAVDQHLRRLGIGGRLLEEVEARLQRKGCLRCYLLVTADNPEAMQYYQNRGWEHMEHILPFAKDLDLR
jgi:N-acetylglutamate synthase